MRAVRVLVIGVLVAGGLTVMAPQATATSGGTAKACQTLKSLDQKLQKALTNEKSGSFDQGAVSDVASSFRKVPKGTPSSLKTAMSELASVASNVSHSGSAAGAAAALKSGGAKLESALVTWGAYITKHCTA
jgi:hypothetical protein